ncbi:MAG: hypothetical protein ACI9AR_000401 [Flavobacteriaceae bacterium]|jgi:hypothetical protein
MNPESYTPTFLNIEYFFIQVLDFFSGAGDFARIGGGADLLNIIKIAATIFCVLLIIFISYLIIRISELKQVQKEMLEVVSYDTVGEAELEPRYYRRWQKVLENVHAENESLWRVAIMEADAMLEEMTKDMNIQGDTLGERLRNVDLSDFLSLDHAWEAHKVRNAIAHEGSEMLLSHQKAKNTIKNYEYVFNEFNLI